MQEQRGQVVVSDIEPLRQSDIRAIASVVGEKTLEDDSLISICSKYNLERWPSTPECQCKADTWRIYLEQSRGLHQRLIHTSEDELRKMFDVGQLVASDIVDSPEQVCQTREHHPICSITHSHHHSLYHNAGVGDRIHATRRRSTTIPRHVGTSLSADG